MELSIDTASAVASLVLSREGTAVAEKTWRCERNHTVEVLPAIDALLNAEQAARVDLTAVFVSTGPGLYTGLRIGIAIAKGIARAMGLPLVGVGRLELDAYPHRDFDGDIVAVHDARRGEFAWAAYRDDPWREVRAPQLAHPEALATALSGRTLVVGEVSDELAAALRAARAGQVEVRQGGGPGRAPSLAALAYQRLKAEEGHEPALVVPVYLRPPAIGPQTPAGGE